MTFRFGDFELDAAHFELRRNGHLVPIQVRTFDVLYYLVRNSDRVVSKRELIAEVWQGASVTKDSLPHAIMAVRDALGDDATHPLYVATVRGRGYRFVGAVEGVSDRPPVMADAACPPNLAASLRAQIEALARREGSVAVVSGAPGTGKTQELRRVSSGTERRILVEGVCGPQPPLWLPTQLMTQWPEVSDALRDALRDGQIAALNAAVDVVVKAARQAPLWVGFDDLHEADEGSLLFVQLLARQICAAPLAVAVAYAPLPPVARVFPAVAAELVAASGPRHEILRPLSPEQTRDALASVLGEEPKSELVAEVYGSTHGNQRLVSWAARRLAATRRSADTAEDAQEREALLAVALRKISNEALALLEIVAVSGEHVRGDVCCELASARPTDALMLLDELAANGIVREDELGYAFAYPMLRTLVLEHMSLSRRASLHARLAGLLSRDLEENSLPATVFEVASHFMHAERAGFGTVAAHWAIRASELARANGDDAVAADYARCALRRLSNLPRTLRQQLDAMSASR